MRMALTGSKHVQGFDIQKHSQHKLGSLIDKKENNDRQDQVLEEEKQESQEEDAQEQPEGQEHQETEEAEEMKEVEEPKEEGEEEKDFDEEAEIAKLIKEEDINVLPEDTDVSEIDKLTGNPKTGDQLLFAIPMLAPYNTINTYRYKAKVTPGTLKRGRAQKTIRSLFLAQTDKKQQHEQNLIKAISDQDMTMTLINSCRVMAPGLQKVQQQNKQDKKKKAKQ